MLNLDLKQAEIAIAAGRLDEAFLLVRKSSNRKHRRGQELLDELASALIERGHEHLASGRLAPAGSDAAKAIECAGQKPKAVELFDAVAQARAAGGQQRREAGEIVDEANRQIALGEASLARRIVKNAALAPTKAQQISRQIDVHQEVKASTIQRVRGLCDDGMFGAALDELRTLVRGNLRPELASLLATALAPVIASAKEDLASGRLDRASTSADRLTSFERWSEDSKEIVSLVGKCRQLQASIAHGRLSDLDEQLHLLHRMLPGAEWIVEARDAAKLAAEAMSLLRSGPLGLLKVQGTFDLQTGGAPLLSAEDVVSFNDLPRRMLLQIDGYGSVLLLTAESVLLGGRSTSRDIDLSLIAEDVPVGMRIVRTGEDYFLQCEHPGIVNGKRMTNRNVAGGDAFGRLLQDGDTISVGTRAGLAFRKPVQASSSAILQPKSVGLARRDVRQVVLMGDSLILGTPAMSHVPLRDQRTPIVLSRTAGGLLARGITASQNGSSELSLGMGESIMMENRRMQLVEHV